MKPPKFLGVEDVLLIHQDTIGREGGLGGLRDAGLLESAVMLPQQRFAGRFLHTGLAAMAAAYLYHLTCNHPFLDGNKRVGVMAAYVFLDVNHVSLTADAEELEHVVMDVAAGRLSKDKLIRWFGLHTKTREVGSTGVGDHIDSLLTEAANPNPRNSKQTANSKNKQETSLNNSSRRSVP